MSPPISSHTEIVMLPVRSATLQDLTSWPSLVLVTRPISRTIKTTFKFFSPALMSFIKRGGSLTPSILMQLRLCSRDLLGKASHPPGPRAEPGATWGGAGDRCLEAVIRDRGNQPWRHQAKRKTNFLEGEKNKTLTSSKIKKTTHSGHRVGGEQKSVRTAAPAKERGSRGRPCLSGVSLSRTQHRRATP